MYSIMKMSITHIYTNKQIYRFKLITFYDRIMTNSFILSENIKLLTLFLIAELLEFLDSFDRTLMT